MLKPGVLPAVLVEVASVGTRGLRISAQRADATRLLIDEVRRGEQETCEAASWGTAVWEHVLMDRSCTTVAAQATSYFVFEMGVVASIDSKSFLGRPLGADLCCSESHVNEVDDTVNSSCWGMAACLKSFCFKTQHTRVHIE